MSDQQQQLNSAMEAVSVTPCSTAPPEQQQPLNSVDLPSALSLLQHQGDDPASVLCALKSIQSIIEADASSIPSFIESGVIANMVQILSQDPQLRHPDHTEAVLRCLNAISNNLSTQHATFLLQAGCAQQLVALLDFSSRAAMGGSSSSSQVELALDCLRNLADSSVPARDYCIGLGVLPILCNFAMMAEKIPASLLQFVMLCMSALFRGKPVPTLELTSPCIPIVVSLLSKQGDGQQGEDTQLAADLLWCLAYFTDGPPARANNVIENGALPYVCHHLANGTQYTKTLIPALRTVGNLVAASAAMVEMMISSCPTLLPSLGRALLQHKRAIRKEAAWTLSNIAAGSEEAIDAILNCPDLFMQVCKTLPCPEFEVKKEAAWCVGNLTSGMNQTQSARLYTEYGSALVEPLLSLLALYDVQLVTVSLEAIENLLSCGAQMANDAGPGTPNPWLQLVISCSGRDRIEQLQHHQSNDVYTRCLSLLDAYFPDDDGGEEGATQSTAVQGVSDD